MTVPTPAAPSGGRPGSIARVVVTTLLLMVPAYVAFVIGSLVIALAMCENDVSLGGESSTFGEDCPLAATILGGLWGAACVVVVAVPTYLYVRRRRR